MRTPSTQWFDQTWKGKKVEWVSKIVDFYIEVSLEQKEKSKRKKPGYLLIAVSTQQYVDVHLFCAVPGEGVDQPIHIVSIFDK